MSRISMKKPFLTYFILLLASQLLISPFVSVAAEHPITNNRLSENSDVSAISEEDKIWLKTKMEELGIFEKDIEEKIVGSVGKKNGASHQDVYLRHIPTGIEVKSSESENIDTTRFNARRDLVKEIEKSSAQLSADAKPDPSPEPAEAAPLELLPVTEENPNVYTYPHIPTTLSLTGGYSFADVDGPKWISESEYEYIKNSVVAGVELRALPFPQRIHLEFDYNSPKDYFGDLSYAYRDIVLFRGVSNAFFHNLENALLLDLGPDPRYTVDTRDVGVEYGIKTGIYNASLRLKTPDFPFHFYANGRLVTSDGSRQQRFLGGSGFFNNLDRTSEKRDVDFETKSITVGVNSHAGPVEFDLSHGEKRFNAGSDSVLFDFYDAAAGRPAGVYPHNLIPDLKSSSNTLQVHSSYTGKLVLSGTISQSSNKNEESGAKADYITESAETTWMPMPEVTLFVKYRHRDADVDNPSSTTITDISTGTSQTYSVRESISSRTDRISGALRYRPANKISLTAEYSYNVIDRDNADAWDLASKTVTNTAALTLRMRVLKNLSFRAKYSYEQIDAPAYNTELDYTNRGSLSLSWTPLARVMTYLGFDLSDGKRDHVQYVIDDQLVTANDRKARTARGIGILGFTPIEGLSLSASYAYAESKVEQSLVYDNFTTPTTFLTDDDSPYKQTAHVLGVNINYAPLDNFNLGGGITYTRAHESFDPSIPDALQPVSIASFSETRTKEIVYSLAGEYTFKGDFILEVRYRYSDFNDELDNPSDYFGDSTGHFVLASLTKRW
jgi:hypothetical protein